MSLPSCSRVGAIFLLLSSLSFTCVHARGRGGGIGSHGSDAISTLDLPPIYTAVFAVNIVVIVITLSQFIRAIRRLRTPKLPPDSPTFPYQVGKLFPSLLLLYTLTLMIHLILYTIFFTFLYSGNSTVVLPSSFAAGSSFVGQLSAILILAALLSIIAYRQRIQLNPAEHPFNMKSFIDGWLLSTTLILGIATDALTGNIDSKNMGIAYSVFLFLASLDVIVSAVVVYIRFKKSDVQDAIIRSMVIIVCPFVFIEALFRIIDLGLVVSPQGFDFNFSALELAGTIIGGIVSIVIVEIALRMGAPPKPPKDAEKGPEKGWFWGTRKA